jgi:DNA uptake protein ComE-like DNA-binding protein
VHLTGGILPRFRAFSKPKQNPALGVLSTPAHPQVTQTVGQLEKQQFTKLFTIIMTENPLVKINIDPPEKIAKLYGIGSKTALLIVKGRKEIGAFHGPDDLAKVKGIIVVHQSWLRLSPAC